MPKRKRAAKDQAEAARSAKKNNARDEEAEAAPSKNEHATKTTGSTTDPTAPKQDFKNEKSISRSNKTTFTIPNANKPPISCERHGSAPDGTRPDLILTHGAGGDLSAPAMQDFATAFSSTSSLVMFKGNMNLKSRVSAFQAVIEHESGSDGDGEGQLPPIALGGRSMGARAACLAAAAAAAGQEAKNNPSFSTPPPPLILISFPLIGASKGDSRSQILLNLPTTTDVLLVIGTNDTMCPLASLLPVIQDMSAGVWLVEVEGADHGMALKAGEGGKQGTKALRERTGEIAARWLREREGLKERRAMRVWWDGEGREVGGGVWEGVEDGDDVEGGEEEDGDEGQS